MGNHPESGPGDAVGSPGVEWERTGIMDFLHRSGEGAGTERALVDLGRTLWCVGLGRPAETPAEPWTAMNPVRTVEPVADGPVLLAAPAVGPAVHPRVSGATRHAFLARGVRGGPLQRGIQGRSLSAAGGRSLWRPACRTQSCLLGAVSVRTLFRAVEMLTVPGGWAPPRSGSYQ
jgi:hypothetical protein